MVAVAFDFVEQQIILVKSSGYFGNVSGLPRPNLALGRISRIDSLIDNRLPDHYHRQNYTLKLIACPTPHTNAPSNGLPSRLF